MVEQEIKPETKEWIQFEDFKEKIKNPFEKGWLIVHCSLENKEKNQISSSIFATFIKKEFKEKSLKDYSWDFKYLDGTFYDEETITPLLFWREFYGVRDSFIEMSQDFIHFFNLIKEGEKYLFIDSSGEEIEVIISNKQEIKVNLNFLFEYMKEKNLILSWGFDIIRYHQNTLAEYGLSELNEKEEEKSFIFSHHRRDGTFPSFNAKSFSSLLGKRLIDVPSDFNISALNPIAEYEEFIIDSDDLGKDILFTCEESKLRNYFGANPESPYFTKPVFFKKEVLDKYYANPSKYSVSDGYLSCNSLWGICIDNGLNENVAVFLGDLGRLPYKEQKYWRLYNISRGNISDPFFRRNFLAEFCSSSNPAEYFKEKMTLFKRKWKDKFSWDLFRDLNKEDEHFWKTLRIPKEEQKEFDEMVEAIIKIFIESINSSEIKKDLILEKNTGSISQFEEYLKQKHSLNSPQMFKFLRNLQELRSKGIHFKNNEYNKIYSYFDKGSFSETFKEILIGTIMVMNTLEHKILNINL